MITDVRLRVEPQVAGQRGLTLEAAAREAGVAVGEVGDMRIVRRSIDARQRRVMVELTVRLFVGEPAPDCDYQRIDYGDVSRGRRVVVVGAGPAGLFAALRLIELGYCPVVLERGKDVHARRKDIAAISREHRVDPESNYSFGEGGAGAYSDGKLFTRSTKRGNVDRILSIFCQHGASLSILSDVHPHIGTDRLPAVIEAMRDTIIASGGEVRMQTCVDGLLRRSSGEVCGVRTAQGEELQGPVILATGHSARDVYRMLRDDAVVLEQKAIAVGVRLEHSSRLIDSIMYHNRAGRGQWLPAAEYRLTSQAGGRGVYSFCMCPGGFVIPAASDSHQLVVNGMSPSGRNGRWSNSGIVVELRNEDLLDQSMSQLLERHMQDSSFAERCNPVGDADPLRMMYMQEALERECWLQGGRRQTAPAQRMDDFVRGRLSASLPQSSYSPGLLASPLHFWLPEFIGSRLREAMQMWGRRYRGFLTNEAVMMPVETRTSAPVRISRDGDTLLSLNAQGLFPCGEGAGYAGGIVSAAIDGERCAEAVARYMQHNA